MPLTIDLAFEQRYFTHPFEIHALKDQLQQSNHLIFDVEISDSFIDCLAQILPEQPLARATWQPVLRADQILRHQPLFAALNAKTIDLSGCLRDSDATNALAENLPPHAKQLLLVGCTLKMPDIILLLKCARRTAIESFDFSDLSGFRAEPGDIESLFGHLETTQLKKLFLRGLGLTLTDEWMTALSHFSLPLEMLDLSRNQLSNPKLLPKFIHMIASQTNVHTLHLDENQISAHTLDQLKRSLDKTASLQHLSLSRNTRETSRRVLIPHAPPYIFSDTVKIHFDWGAYLYHYLQQSPFTLHQQLPEQVAEFVTPFRNLQYAFRQGFERQKCLTASEEQLNVQRGTETASHSKLSDKLLKHFKRALRL